MNYSVYILQHILCGISANVRMKNFVFVYFVHCVMNDG